jgi:hypothetical protein
MRDGGEPPIPRGLKPDHRGEISSTRNLAGKEKGGKRYERDVRGDHKKRSEELWNKI